ncbi:MAG: DUF2007 domain-containing protein [Candidatus Latescibacteria bacterium]|nr:DUF2007 domain-containing protein [Candidatus Latescibacterota bacterium]
MSSRPKQSDLVELHIFPGEAYAQMVKEALEKEGIPCLLQKDSLSSVYVVQGSTESCPTRILVREEDLQQAASIMEPMIDHI